MTEQNIHRALIKAMSEVTKVQKSSRNVEQKYDFASIDDFLAMAGPICAANGLYTVMDESDVAEFERQGKYGVTHWLRVRFCLTTYHESGASLPPVYRTVEVIRTGAQSFGSAQSYALKQYLRVLLLIPTGDKDDVDSAEKGEGAPSPVQQGNKAPAKMTADQFQQITGLIERTASDEAKLCAYFKVAELHDLTAQQADQTIAMLTKKLGAE
jgi:hypothetical protein